MSWILCAWMGYDELEWVGFGNMKGIGFKGRHKNISLHGEYYLTVWSCVVCVSA